jgi:hypothetical protein
VDDAGDGVMRVSEGYFRRLLHQTEANEALAAFGACWEARLLPKGADGRPCHTLSPAERTVHEILGYGEAVTVGGHPEYFFRHREKTHVFGALALSLQRLGLTAPRRALAEALCLLPGDALQQPEHASAIDRAMAARREREGRFRAVELLDEAVWRAADLDAALLRFLRAHEDQLLCPERGRPLAMTLADRGNRQLSWLSAERHGDGVAELSSEDRPTDRGERSDDDDVAVFLAAAVGHQKIRGLDVAVVEDEERAGHDLGAGRGEIAELHHAELLDGGFDLSSALRLRTGEVGELEAAGVFVVLGLRLGVRRRLVCRFRRAGHRGSVFEEGCEDRRDEGLFVAHGLSLPPGSGREPGACANELVCFFAVPRTLRHNRSMATANVTKNRGARFLLVAVLFLASFAVVLVVLSPRLFAGLIERKATEAGLSLSYDADALSVGLTEVKLSKVRFSLLGAPMVTGTAEAVTVETFGWTLRKATGRGVQITATGSVGQLGQAVGAWAKAHPESTTLESSFTNVGMLIQPSAQLAPVLRVVDATVAGRAGTWSLRPQTFELYGASLAGTELEARAVANGLSVAVGGTSASAPVVALLDTRGPTPVLTAELRPTAVSPLVGAGKSIEASGRAVVQLPENGALNGTFDVKLAGFVPPGPTEIVGLFGNTTLAKGAFATAPGSTRVDLSNVQITAGALTLRGKGTAEIPGAYALLELSLAGSLPCNLLGATVAKNTVGGALGGLLGGLVQNTVTGDIPVATTIAADTRALAKAKVDTTAEVRCGLGLAR